MASKLYSEEDLSCPVCYETFRDPIILGCRHRACKSCLEKFWETKGSRECPVCRTKSLPGILAEFSLKNLKGKSERLCRLHSKEFGLFCMNDRVPLCLDCCNSKMHANHRFCSLKEVAQDYKTKLSAALKTLKEKEEMFTDCKQSWDQAAEHLVTQAQNTERQIKEEFEKLHQFLRDEEAASIAVLRKEEEQKSQVMLDKTEKMSREKATLRDTIRAVEEQMEAEDFLFVRNYKDTVERAQRPLQVPEKFSGTLLNVADHLSNLKFTVWERMKEIVKYSPVTPDPNTAHPTLTFSDELTTVRRLKEIQPLPDNPERFDFQHFVLASEGFDSGMHCWEVEVGECKFWGLGVIAESADRKGNIGARRGMWGIMLYNSVYVAGASPNLARLPTQDKLQRVTLELDWNKGRLKFYDSLTKKLLYTEKHRFTEKVFPGFLVNDENESCIKILPVQYFVSLKQPK